MKNLTDIFGDKITKRTIFETLENFDALTNGDILPINWQILPIRELVSYYNDILMD